MKKSPKPTDMNSRMFAVVQEAAGLTESPQVSEKDPEAVKRGRMGGQARAKGMNAAQRVAAAKTARAARTERAHEAVKLHGEHRSG